eukprot:scaffold97383_cov48-Attheya_sp.AAC.3
MHPWQASPSPAVLLNSLRTVSINYTTGIIWWVIGVWRPCNQGAPLMHIPHSYPYVPWYLSQRNDETAANLVDGVMDSIGHAGVDWHVVTLDGISTHTRRLLIASIHPVHMTQMATVYVQCVSLAPDP